jgi:hypothetical protein
MVKRTVRSTNARSTTRSPRRSWRPPTPHPEGKPRGPKPRRSPTPVGRADGPTRYPSSAPYPPLSYGHCYPGYHGQVQQHVDYAPYMVPPVPHLMIPSGMSYTAWPMPSIPWPVPMTQSMKAGCPPGCECHYEHAYGPQLNGDGAALYGPPPPQAYLHPQPQSQPQMQQQSRAGTEYDAHLHPVSRSSRSSTERDDTKRPSHSRSVKSRHGQQPSMSNSVLATNGSVVATPLKTQVERIKHESRGVSAIPNHDKHPDI